MSRKKENQQVEEQPKGDEKESRINDSTSLTEMDLPHKEEFAQELNPLNHVPLALEMNKFDEITTCVKDRE